MARATRLGPSRLVKSLVALTFIVGLLPTIGNLLSNTPS
jgi:hypothetical protein